MADQIQVISKRPELLTFADAIIAVQTKEFKQMRAWMMGQAGNNGQMMNTDTMR